MGRQIRVILRGVGLTKSRQRQLFLVLWMLAIAAIIYGSLAPDLSPPGGGIVDKFEHAGAYFVLSCLAFAAFASHRRRLAALGFLFLLGIGLELAQGFLGGREASALDQVANAMGILLALAGLTWFMRWRRGLA